MDRQHRDHRLLIVTGKGGVGKTLLAAALARISARQGRRTVLVTMDSRDDQHPLLGVPLRYRPQPSGLGFDVSRVDAFEAVAEYARRTMPMGLLYEGVFRSRAFRDFASAAPGFEALMCLGKLFNLATQTDYRQVVFDAPATGHLRELLEVPAATQRAVQVGPLNHNARKIEDLLLDPDRTRVLVATLPEEMPVREAMETVALCRDHWRMGVGPVLVNRLVTATVSADELSRLTTLEADGALSPAARQAVAVARNRQALAMAQAAALAPLAAIGLPMLRVPRLLAAGVGGEGLLDEVARHLEPGL
jgi:anion-transporting  ArsA/GET3 family ATPase